MGEFRLLTTQLLPLIDIKSSFFLSVFRTNEWILIKFCIYIDIYKIWVGTITCIFPVIFNKSYGP